MAPPFIFLAHRSLLDQHTAHDEIQTQLRKQGGCREVQYVPSSIRRHEVRATIDSTIFLEETYPSDTVELRIEFDFPEDADYDHYQIQWIDGERNYSFGWHQDETHSELGECHFQLDYQDETIARKPAVFHDTHPVNVLEKRRSLVPSILELVAWENDYPCLSQWPPHDV